ncbi:hypothetical protein ACF3MZ_30355 [Paenibacillaceae bacterium WGS1546]|uniref:hypothetical protein n=1 Tax=Cohnella sp. WGS1546 TaxID=3366810 RepID=UPI00372D27FF
MKARNVYIGVILLIAASWLGNGLYHQTGRLPEAGFLRHYIETNEVPSVAFDLLYVANNDDKRKLNHVQLNEIPSLRLQPPQVHQRLRHQTIYIVRGYYDEEAIGEREAMEPLRLHTVTAYYSDGSSSEEDVGEIIVYREARRSEPAKEPAIQMSFVRGSSDHSGDAAVRVLRPVEFTGVTSAWLERLGGGVEYEVRPNDSLPITDGSSIMLDQGQSFTLKYRFKPESSNIEPLSVYRLLLKMNFAEPNGEKHDYTVFANYDPYVTEAEMRAYVRERRKEHE